MFDNVKPEDIMHSCPPGLPYRGSRGKATAYYLSVLLLMLSQDLTDTSGPRILVDTRRYLQRLFSPSGGPVGRPLRLFIFRLDIES